MHTKKEAIPLMVIAAILPLIYYFHFQETEFYVFPWFPNRGMWMDIALYGKSRLLMLVGVCMAVWLAIRGVQKKLQKPGKKFIFLAAFGIFQILSACFSQYPQYSVSGIMEQYEPIGVLLSYLVICFYAYEYVMGSKEIGSIGWALFAGMSVLCALGLTQLIQHDFWETDLGKILMVPERFAEYRGKLRFNFSAGEWGSVYMTLYNPNYAGIYLVLISPLLFLWGNKKLRALEGAGVLCLVGTFSKTAAVAAGIIFAAAIDLFFWKKADKKCFCLAGTVVFLTGLVWMMQGAGKELREDRALEEAEAGADAVRIVYNGVSVYLRHVPDSTGGVKQDLRYEDGSKVYLEWSEERGECDAVDERLRGLHVKAYEKDGINYVQFRCQDVVFRFTDSMGTGRYEYVSLYGKLDELREAQKAFSGYDSFLTGRGYIWSRTLPLIGRFPLLGTGPGTFMLMFPQDDYVAKSGLGGEFFVQILTNAHNFYLHTAAETGIPSLLCFLIFAGWYIRDSLILYWGRRTYQRAEKIGAGIFLGVAGYLLCGLTWASSVCVAPVFWMLLGAGCALNERIYAGEKIDMDWKRD